VDIDSKKYFLHLALPVVLIYLVTVAALLLTYPSIFGGIYLFLLYGISFVVIIAVFLLYPFIKKQARVKRIEQDMQLFITRAGVLATSAISRKGIFDIVSEMKEYGELAKEINKVYMLIDKWGVSVGEACRRISKLTPSVVFGDFLERLAYGVEAGEDSKTFFTAEQEIIFEEYKSLYNQAADTIDMVTEIFIAITIVMAFIILIVSMIPFIIGINTTTLFVLSAILFISVEALMLYVFSAYVPRERVWEDTDIKTKVSVLLNYYFIGSLVVSAVTGLLVFIVIEPIFKLGFPICMAITFSPLIISGYYSKSVESKVIRRDDNFPAFIRSLGSTSETSSIVPVAALKRLRRHDFGPLTKNINSLYSRLKMRIDPFSSWRYFGAETGSDLITKFSSMFVRGLKAGGKPGESSNIISYNFTKILGLRKRRYTLAQSLSGIFIGIAIVISIVFFMAAGLVDILSDLVVESGVNENYLDVQVLFTQPYSVSFFINLLFIVIIIHAAITSLIQVIVTAGHKYTACFNFVFMVWIGAAMSKAAPWVIKSLLG